MFYTFLIEQPEQTCDNAFDRKYENGISTGDFADFMIV